MLPRFPYAHYPKLNLGAVLSNGRPLLQPPRQHSLPSESDEMEALRCHRSPG